MQAEIRKIRHMDDKGRVHIPTKIRKALDLHADSDVEVLLEGDTIKIRKHASSVKINETSTEETK